MYKFIKSNMTNIRMNINIIDNRKIIFLINCSLKEQYAEIDILNYMKNYKILNMII